MYIQRQHDRVYQGDIFTDFVYSVPETTAEGITINKITEAYVVVLSQDCDLKWDAEGRSQPAATTHDKYIANIILAPAYLSESLRQGDHLKPLGLKMQTWNSDLWKPIKGNKNERFHLLKENQAAGLPELVIDFKRFYAIPREMIYQIDQSKYKTSLDVPYREDVSRRFANFVSRIGLPDALA